MLRPFTLLFLSCVAVATPLPASAQATAADELSEAQRAQYRAHYLRGVELTREDRWSDALAEFERARRLLEHPNVLRNIGVALSSLGRHIDALTTFERLLELTPPEARGDIEALMEGSRQHLAHVTLRGLPEGAQVSVDGRPVEAPATELVLDPGQHRLDARAQGYEETHLDLDVAPGESREEQLSMVAIAQTEPPSAAQPPPEDEADEEEAPPPPVVTDPAGWIVAGIGGALFAGSAAVLVIGVTFQAEIEGRTTPAPWDEFAARHADAPILQGVGAAGSIAGLALVGLGIGLALSEQPGGVEARLGPGTFSVRSRF